MRRKARGYNAGMERKSGAQPRKRAEKAEIVKEAEDARQGDRELDDYDKAVADSFPASDPPAQP